MLTWALCAFLFLLDRMVLRPGFPLGVKFDPSDVELLEHLAAKCGIGNTQQHMFINEFILTLEGDQGICYTHPENLPGEISLTFLLSIQICKLLPLFLLYLIDQ